MTVRVIHGDCRDVLRTLPDQSVHCVVTSPPYYGLRDYGVDGQMGLEDTPEQFIAGMVHVFREVRRVLRDDGTLWINIGDSYASSGGISQPHRDTNGGFGSLCTRTQGYAKAGGGFERPRTTTNGIKIKDLIGIPWMLAFALRADGWYLRSEIIWHKPNPMPESVTDRPTKAHEQIFLLTKSPRYYYDAEAIKEAGTVAAGTKGAKGSAHRAATPGVNSRPPEYKIYDGTRNARSVWTIATKPYPEAHFATFPPAIPERCIKAGTSERGCCAACGAPWVRMVEKNLVPTAKAAKRNVVDQRDYAADTKDQGANRQKDGHVPGLARQDITLGWEPSCQCNAATIPCAILDPFGGAGTTGLVADRLQRDAILIELNPKYAEMARRRIADDAGLLGVA